MMATTQSIIAGEPPNNTNSIVNLSIGDSYGYSVVGARLMVVEHEHCGRCKNWSCELGMSNEIGAHEDSEANNDSTRRPAYH